MMILEHPPLFKEGVRILIRMTRNKDGAVGNVDRHAKKIITRSPEEFDAAIEELVSTSQEGERVYSTVEARDVKKAIRLFKNRQLDADYDGHIEDFYLDIKNRWVSCLQNPRASSGTLFLFDCDDAETHLSVVNTLKERGHGEKILHDYPTKNGAHVITKPFDYTKLPPELHKVIHKNALILWAY